MLRDNLLLTKFHIPALRANSVPRPQLIAQLEKGLQTGSRLTLISAPAGFGKTTLIQEWLTTLERPVAWLSVDEGDNDPVWFLKYLIAAPGRVTDQIGQSLSEEASPEQVVISLINDLSNSHAELLLVLDDYHLIGSFAVHDLMAFLLENQPDNFHVVIATREDPPLPLARMRARGQITEIRERALRFRVDEVAAFFKQTMGLDLPAESIAALENRTEGWVTGLQLAGVALRQQGDTETFVADFAGDDRYVMEYLMVEVLSRTSETLRHFLRQTSILARLSASLCDALTGQSDSQTMLEHIENSNLFLIPLDNRREWYRYHGLFADVLRLTLSDQEQIDLHHKAAGWYQAHGFDNFAYHHLNLIAELSTTTESSRHNIANQTLIEPLSEREIEVLTLIAIGYSNADIARQLYIATGTVKRHINNIYGKLAVGSRTQAVARAQEIGLIR